MNKKSLILLPVAMLFLAGCNNDTTPSSSTSSSETPTPTPSTSTTTSQTVTVNYGSLTAPLSIAEFNTEVAKLGLKDNEFSTEHFFVKGYVYADPTYYSDSSSYLLKLTDGKESEAYINAGGVKLDTGVEEPYKNDTVVVEGLAELYGTNYSIWSTKTDSPALKSVTRGTSTVTSSIENGTITGLNATYTNGATASFTVAVNSGYKISSVTAYGDELTAVEGKYSFTVGGDAEVKVITAEESSKDVVKTINLASSSFTADESDSKIATYTEDGIEFTLDQNKSSTKNKLDDGNLIRVYASAKFTIKVNGTISKIVYTCTSDSYATALKKCTFTGGTVDSSSTGTEVTVNATASEVSFTDGAQVRLSKVAITYVPAE